MGAWGIGSFENDTALDYIPELINFDSLNEKLKRLLPNKIDHYHYDEIRVSVTILIHLHKINNFWVKQEVLNNLSLAMKIILNDKSWYNTWRCENDAKNIKLQIRRDLIKLRKLKGY